MDKGTLGLYIMILMVCLQSIAWILNKDGAITGLIGLVIGGIAGSLFTFKVILQQKK